VRVETLLPDAPPASPSSGPPDDESNFGRVLDALGSVLESAESAEDAFANGNGALQTAVYERARADVALSIATAAAGRTAQAITSVLNMQV
jgi:flagellar hook-basal body complex protein FliE